MNFLGEVVGEAVAELLWRMLGGLRRAITRGCRWLWRAGRGPEPRRHASEIDPQGPAGHDR